MAESHNLGNGQKAVEVHIGHIDEPTALKGRPRGIPVARRKPIRPSIALPENGEFPHHIPHLLITPMVSDPIRWAPKQHQMEWAVALQGGFQVDKCLMGIAWKCRGKQVDSAKLKSRRIQ